MKFRPQRGGLSESMAEVVKISPTIKAIADKLGVNASRVTVEPYTYDERIGWNTHLVSVDGDAVGFTDGAVNSPAKPGQLIECANPKHLWLGSIHYIQPDCVAKSPKSGCDYEYVDFVGLSRLADSDESWQASEALLKR